MYIFVSETKILLSGMTEEAFTEWKNNTRQAALEKEVQRLRSINRKQSERLGNTRRILYFTVFFFVVLFTILLIKGMLVLPGKNEKPVIVTQHVVTPAEKVYDSLSKENEEIPVAITDSMPVPIKDTKGIIYCVQIGAYTGVDLGEFSKNLVSLQQDTYEGINQFTLGRFTDYNKALDFLAVIQQLGFQDAFIMSFKNGRRVAMKRFTNKNTKPSYISPKDTLRKDSLRSVDSLFSNP